MIRRELGVLLVVVLLGTYWTVCAVMVARNLAGPSAPTETPMTTAVAPGSTPVIAHIEETP